MYLVGINGLSKERVWSYLKRLKNLRFWSDKKGGGIDIWAVKKIEAGQSISLVWIGKLEWKPAVMHRRNNRLVSQTVVYKSFPVKNI